MKARRTCPHCAALMVEYRHNLNRGLAEALTTAWERNGLKPFNPAHIPWLTHNQLANWQKLRYWQLIQQEGDKAKGGLWSVTDLGRLWIMGRARVPKLVWTYRSEPVDHPDGVTPAPSLVGIDDVLPGYNSRVVHAMNARIATSTSQGELFAA